MKGPVYKAVQMKKNELADWCAAKMIERGYYNDRAIKGCRAWARSVISGQEMNKEEYDSCPFVFNGINGNCETCKRLFDLPSTYCGCYAIKMGLLSPHKARWMLLAVARRLEKARKEA